MTQKKIISHSTPPAPLTIEDVFRIQELADIIVKEGALGSQEIAALRHTSKGMRDALTTNNPLKHTLLEKPLDDIIRLIQLQHHVPYATQTMSIAARTDAPGPESITITSPFRVQLPYRASHSEEARHRRPFTFKFNDLFNILFKLKQEKSPYIKRITRELLLQSMLNIRVQMTNPKTGKEREAVKANTIYLLKRVNDAHTIAKSAKDFINDCRDRDGIHIPPQPEEKICTPPHILFECTKPSTIRLIDDAAKSLDLPFEINFRFTSSSVANEPCTDDTNPVPPLRSLCLSDIPEHDDCETAMSYLARLQPDSDSIHLKNCDLRRIAPSDIDRIFPNTIHINTLDLSQSRIRLETLIKLLDKIVIKGDLRLRGVALSELTNEHINSIPDGWRIRDLDLSHTHVSAPNLVLLLNKLKPIGRTCDLYLASVDLRALIDEDITAIPNEWRVRDLDLSHTHVSVPNLVLLLNKLKPSGTLTLHTPNLDGFNDIQANRIDDAIELQALHCTNITQFGDRFLLLLAKLFPKKTLHLKDINLNNIPVEDIVRPFDSKHLDTLQIDNVTMADNTLWPILNSVTLRHTLSINHGHLHKHTERPPETRTHTLHTLDIRNDNHQDTPYAVGLLINTYRPTHTLRLKGVNLTHIYATLQIPARSIHVLDLGNETRHHRTQRTHVNDQDFINLLRIFNPTILDITELEVPSTDHTKLHQLALVVTRLKIIRGLYTANFCYLDADPWLNSALQKDVKKLTKANSPLQPDDKRLFNTLQRAISAKGDVLELSNIDCTHLNHRILNALNVGTITHLILNKLTLNTTQLAMLINKLAPKQSLNLRKLSIKYTFFSLADQLNSRTLNDLCISDCKLSIQEIFDVFSKISVRHALILHKMNMVNFTNSRETNLKPERKIGSLILEEIKINAFILGKLLRYFSIRDTLVLKSLSPVHNFIIDDFIHISLEEHSVELYASHLPPWEEAAPLNELHISKLPITHNGLDALVSHYWPADMRPMVTPGKPIRLMRTNYLD